MKLLTFSNPKVQKGTKFGYLTAILHLAPHKLSGHNVCPKASPECIALCLNTAGRGGIIKHGETTNRIQECRIRRTKLFTYQYDEFMRQLVLDIHKVCSIAWQEQLKPAIRLNGTSDIPWENCKVGGFDNIFAMFPEVQFYDYTKIPGRKTLPNYHLTFSLSEVNTEDAMNELIAGRNIAVVFRKVPETYANRPVVDGDESDLRFLDPANVIVGLKAKGKARKSTFNFVK
jgi:hypothetical protein